MPLFMEVHFLRDYRFALQSFIKASSAAPALSGLEKAKLAEVDDHEIKRNSYMLSGMFLPSLGSVYIASVRVMNLRWMTFAGDVMEYRKQHGKLPEDLSFLSEVPLAKLDHKPLMYEKTEEGFRIFCHTDKGEKLGGGRYTLFLSGAVAGKNGTFNGRTDRYCRKRAGKGLWGTGFETASLKNNPQ